MINLARITALILYVITRGGYAGLFFLSLVESGAIPIPSEVVLPFSGYLAAIGQFNLIGVIIVATVANLAGGLILFEIGRAGGRWILERYGKYILVSRRDLDRADRWFRGHGPATVFWSRLLPGIRTFSSLSAGIADMPVGKFSMYTFLGSLPWNAALAYIGYKAGEHWDLLKPYFQTFDRLVILIVVVGIIWYVVRHFRSHD